MYEQNVYFPDVYKGCKNDCVYCKPSFQRQAKRQKQRCQKCYTFEPHRHFERMRGRTPATQPGQFLMFPKGGDLSYTSNHEWEAIIDFIAANPQTTFLIQTKRPKFLLRKKFFPKNLILGITLESTNLSWTTFDYMTPSTYQKYRQISKAPYPITRICDFESVKHNRKAVTVEPILKFNMDFFVQWILGLKPEFVYIGYDTKGCKLPEPTLAETLALIEALEKEGIEVRKKTIRKAWYEEGAN